MYAVFDFLRYYESEVFKEEYPSGVPFSGVELGQWFLGIGSILLAIVVVFWGFVAANKLWPIKGKSKTTSGCCK
jgi:hypothetical protein